ncbi:MAG: hypothetical protein AAGE52_31030 [Myxococcota bacterium]
MTRLPIAGLLLVGVLLGGCGESSTPVPRTDGGEDATIVPEGDSDRDGLCDATEIMRGTDPGIVDTDADGFSDYAEVLLGFNAVEPASPDRETVYVLRETPEATLQVPLTRAVSGAGEDYSGAFQSTGDPDDAGDTADTFFMESTVTFAEPPENVAIIDTETESFRGVVGRTLLGFEVRFAFGSATPRVCARAHQWRYNIKRSDGRLIGAETGLLLVLPPGQTLATADWCLPVGGRI